MDIYYELEYGRLYEKIEDGVAEEFLLETPNGTIKNIFIKRKIKNTSYYDAVTPYGYGGPIVTEARDKEKLLKEYEEKFTKYCSENNIVSEFIRFHPIYENALDFKEIYNVEFSRKTIGTDIGNYSDPVREEFDKHAKKEIRRAIKKGVVVNVITKPENLENFKKLYYETMQRNGASDYYFFDDNYFDQILKQFKENILLIELAYENTVISSELYLAKGELLHAHLLGSNKTAFELYSGSLQKASAVEWGKEHGFKYIHYGGGRTSDPEDSLFKYKKKFGKNTEFDFYIGRKIWNKAQYKKLVDERQLSDDETNSGFFPLYRL